MAATDARPVPLKNTAYRVYFPILDADGDFVSAATALDSEVSLDGAAFSDCTNEATEIGTSGIYYLDLTSSEMNADAVVVQVKTTSSGAKTTPIVLYPEETGDINVDVTGWNGTAIPAVHTAGYPIVTIKDGTGTGEINTNAGAIALVDVVTTLTNTVTLADASFTAAKWAADAITNTALAASAVTEIQAGLSTLTAAQVQTECEEALQVYHLDHFTIDSGTAQAGGSSTITLKAGSSATTDYYLHSIVRIVAGTGANQTPRIINAYNGTTKVATVSPAWATAPDNTSEYLLLNNAEAHVGQLETSSHANVRTAVGLASANLDTQLSTIDDFLDTEIAAILAAVDTEVAAIKTDTAAILIDTNELQTDWTNGGRLDLLIDAILDDTGTSGVVIVNGGISEAKFAADTAKYQAKVWLLDDDTGTTDRYLVVWYKNGEPVVSGITSPTIQVFKAADGTDLIASTAMTQIASTGTYKYDATGASRFSDGAGYVAKVQASIDSGTRSWYQPVGRDT